MSPGYITVLVTEVTHVGRDAGRATTTGLRLP